MVEARIPKERWFHIAQQKLTALGIATRLSDDGGQLIGTLEIPPDKLINPLNDQTIRQITCEVIDHDRLILIQPPVVANLPAMSYLRCTSLDTLVEQIRVRLHKRTSNVQQMSRRLREMGVSNWVDAERCLVVAVVDLSDKGSVTLEGDEAGLRVISWTAPAETEPMPLKVRTLDINEFGERAHLEIILSEIILGKQQAPSPARPVSNAPQQQTSTASQPDTGSALTIRQLAQLFGPDAWIKPGLVVFSYLQVGGQTVQVAFRLEEGGLMLARVATPAGVAWSDRISVNGFPGIETLVAQALGISREQVPRAPAMAPPQDAAPEEPEALVLENPQEALAASHEQTSSAMADLIGDQVMPVVGEVWVMNMLVEQDDGQEVRYVATDIDGQPYGAPRVLKREDFLRAFVEISPGIYRLAVEITRIQAGMVEYIQLGKDRERSSEPRSTRLAAFISNFIPEAASY